MRLSICIPTYNRGPFIGQLLDSILAQAGHECEVEVVISDNASTDETEKVIATYRDRFDRLVYYRAETNQGADRNFLKVVQLATGDYCWLMGSDDIVEPGSVARIALAIRENPGVGCLSVRNNAYSYAMDEQLYQRAPGSGAFAHSQRLVGADRVFSAIGDYFGYISSNVVDRLAWNHVVSTEDVSRYFNAYVHVYVIGRILQQKPLWYYVAEPCVGWRAGNDSFLSDGLFRRMEIDVLGFDQIGSGLFGRNSVTARRLNKRMLYHVAFHIIGAKWNGAPRFFFVKARALTMRVYRGYPLYWAKVFPLFLLPATAFHAGRAIYRKTLKPIRRRRIVNGNLAAGA